MNKKILEKLDMSTLLIILGDLATHEKFLEDYQFTITKEQVITEIVNMNDTIERFGDTPLKTWQENSDKKRRIWENT